MLECVDVAGSRRTAEPHVGDFGLLRVDGVLVGAIMSSCGWAVRSAKGVGFLPKEIKAVRAWAL